MNDIERTVVANEATEFCHRGNVVPAGFPMHYTGMTVDSIDFRQCRDKIGISAQRRVNDADLMTEAPKACREIQHVPAGTTAG